MGIGGISPWQLLIILAIVIMIFGTKRLKNIGGDVGGAIKGFKKAMNEDDKAEDTADKKVEAETLEQKATADANFAEMKSEEKQK